VIDNTPLYVLSGVRKRRAHAGMIFELVVPHLTVGRGEILTLRGASGSGKSTLLDLLATALPPDQADRFELLPAGGPPIDVAALWRAADLDALSDLRANHIGYVLQTGGLLPFLSVRDNIGLPVRLAGHRTGSAVDQLALRLGIANHLAAHPERLSVGERQRVAIARALAHAPALVLADEPTASVDPLTADVIFDLFIELVRGAQTAAIIATHDWTRADNAGLRAAECRVERDGDVVRSFFWT
jgi:putative ABC transport system ATP-binding protein